MDTSEQRKARGAFFTPSEISDYLVNWAIRTPDDIVLEPSCGEASFLLCAASRLESLGANRARWHDQLQGVEIFENSAHKAERTLRDAGFDGRVFVGDFFEFEPPTRYDAVVGNPPYVRYQNFTGAARARSLEAALSQGVRLSGLASSWAAFVVQSALHLRPEGRLALVLPAELLSVKYAQEVRRFLLKRFRRIRLIMFEERVFPGVLEEVVLLLAEGTGGAECFEVHQARDLQSLQPVDTVSWTKHAPAENEKWTPALIAHDAFEVYRNLCARRFEDLSAWGNAYLGTVTGNNRFFTLTSSEIKTLELCNSDVISISPPGTRHLRGVEFTDNAWRYLACDGARCYLFYPHESPSSSALRYIRHGEESGVSKAYKCRMRKPWWRVPLVEAPDLLLTYMNHDRPRLIANVARTRIINSLYGIRLKHGRKEIGRDVLPLACLNSLTLLGSEIVGRAYGGGLLKMEPREADKLPVPSLPLVKEVRGELEAMKPQLATALRNGDIASAVEKIDQIVLSGVKQNDLALLRLARDLLFQRRRSRGKSADD